MLQASSLNDVDDQKCTFNNFYYAPLNIDDEEEDSYIINHSQEDEQNTARRSNSKRQNSDNIDVFFDAPKKRKKITSSIVGRSLNDGISYITTNLEDSSQASHLVKIEIYDIKKILKIPTDQQWKHADVRVKYYTRGNNKNFERTKGLVYQITKEIAEVDGCKKYFIHNKTSK